ncbi:MAG TPA: methyltransferase domain-containing protein [Phycisphaerae bacterium]|nr:methyltransferase domain-containing protein [Phycisphaerae bacterium]
MDRETLLAQYVQYGCGGSSRGGWRNFDASPTLRFERLPLIGKLYSKNDSRFPEDVEYGDIVRGLPIAPDSCQGVYCSHVLEHLCLDDFRVALRNTYCMLRAGGIFRLVMPDLEYYIHCYVKTPTPDAALVFMKRTLLGQEKRERSLKGFMISWLGNSQHRWMWDFKSVEYELQGAGFIGIRRAEFGDSSDPMFQKVEEKDRWDNCLGVECRR